MRSLKFTDEAWADYLYWQVQDKKTLSRVNKIIQAAVRDPLNGMGKPEALKGTLSGLWSRRIDEQNRLVCQVTDQDLIVISCRHHHG